MALFNTTTPTLVNTNPFNSTSGVWSHHATDWIVAEKATGKVAWESIENQVALTRISVPPGVLKEETEYMVYSRYIGIDGGGNLGYSPYGVFELEVGKVRIQPPTVNATGAPNNLPSDPEVFTSGFVTLIGTDIHVATDWIVEALDGSVVFQSLTDTVNKTSITLPEGTLMPLTTYKFKVRHIGQNSSSPFTEALFTTQDKALAPPEISIEGEPDAIDNRPLITTSPFDMIIGTDTHVQTEWNIYDDGGNVVLSRTYTNAIPGNTGLTLLDLNVENFDLNWNTPYVVEVTYSGTTVSATSTKQFTVMREPLVVLDPVITVEGEPNNILTNPELSVSPFATNYNSDTHTQTDWTIYLADASGNIINNTPVHQFSDTDVDPTTYQLALGTLDPDTDYVVTAVTRGTVLIDGVQTPATSPVASKHFKTVDITIDGLTVTIDGASGSTPNTVVGGPNLTTPISSVPELILSNVTVNPAGADTHVSTTWRIYEANSSGAIIANDPVWDSVRNAVNLTQIIVPDGILDVFDSGTNGPYYVLEVIAHGNIVDSAPVTQLFSPNIKIDKPNITPPSGSEVTTLEPAFDFTPLTVTPSNTTLTNMSLHFEIAANGGATLYTTNQSVPDTVTTNTVQVLAGSGLQYGESYVVTAYYSGVINGITVRSKTLTATYTIPSVAIETPTVGFEQGVNPNVLPRNPNLVIGQFIVTPAANLATYTSSTISITEIDTNGNPVQGGFQQTWSNVDLSTVGGGIENGDVVFDLSTLPGWPTGGLDRENSYLFEVFHTGTKAANIGGGTISSNAGSVTGTVPGISISSPQVTLRDPSTGSEVPRNQSNEYYMVPSVVNVTAGSFSATPPGVQHDATIWTIVNITDNTSVSVTVTGPQASTNDSNFIVTGIDLTSITGLDLVASGYEGKTIQIQCEYVSETYASSPGASLNTLVSRITESIIDNTLYYKSGTNFIALTSGEPAKYDNTYVRARETIAVTPAGSDTYRAVHSHIVNNVDTTSEVSGNSRYVKVPTTNYGVSETAVIKAVGASGREGPAATVSYIVEQQPSTGSVGVTVADIFTQQPSTSNWAKGSAIEVTVTNIVNITNVSIRVVLDDNFGTGIEITTQSVPVSANGTAALSTQLDRVLTTGSAHRISVYVTDASNTSGPSSSAFADGNIVDVTNRAIISPVNGQQDVPFNGFTFEFAGHGNPNITGTFAVEDTLVIDTGPVGAVTTAVNKTYTATQNNYTDNSIVLDPGTSYGARISRVVKNSGIAIADNSVSNNISFNTAQDTNKWTELYNGTTNLPDRLVTHNMVAIDGYIYLSGGQAPAPSPANQNDNAPSLVDENYNLASGNDVYFNSMLKSIRVTDLATSTNLNGANEAISGTRRRRNATLHANVFMIEPSGSGNPSDVFIYQVGGLEEYYDSVAGSVKQEATDTIHFTQGGVETTMSGNTAWGVKSLNGRRSYAGFGCDTDNNNIVSFLGFHTPAAMHIGQTSGAVDAYALDSSGTVDSSGNFSTYDQNRNTGFLVTYRRSDNSLNVINFYSVQQEDSTGDITPTLLNGTATIPNGAVLGFAEAAMKLTPSGRIIIIGGVILRKKDSDPTGVELINNDSIYSLTDLNGTGWKLKKEQPLPFALSTLASNGALRYPGLVLDKYASSLILFTNDTSGRVFYLTGDIVKNSNLNNPEWWEGTPRTNSTKGLGLNSHSSYGLFGAVENMYDSSGTTGEIYLTGGHTVVNGNLAATPATELQICKYTPNGATETSPGSGVYNLITTGLTPV